MMKFLVLSAAACAFVASSVLPSAAFSVPKTSLAMSANTVTLAKDKRGEEWLLGKKKPKSDGQWHNGGNQNGHHDGHKKRSSHRSRPSIQFYYDPWPYYGYHYDPYYYDDYYYSHDWVYRAPMRTSRAKHVRWCKNHYRTYNPRTDKYIGKNGKKYRCNSPYDGR